MIYIFASVYSFIASLRVPNIILWTIVILALGTSLSDQSQGWGMYHYYVGSKYFAEVGYFDLYECTITEATPRRDLRNYDYRLDAPNCTSNFTDARYQEFQADIIASEFYPQAMIDKGYNGTPTWTAIFGTLANWNIITPYNAHLIDIVVLVSALFFCVWSVGWRKSAYIALIVLTWYGTLDRVWGHYAQWVWLGVALVGVCQLEKRNAFGAILIGISASLAIFPMFLMLKYRQLKYYILFGVSLLTMLTIGLANGRGINGYFEFIDNMQLHSSYVKIELCCNVGLSHTLTWSQNPYDVYRGCFVEWNESCPTSYDRQVNPLLYFVTLPFVMTSPLGVMHGLLSLSIYYYLILAVIPIWYGERWSRLLLFLNVVLPMSVIFNLTLLPYRDWLYYLYFVAIGATHVTQAIQNVVGNYQQGLYPQIATGYVSDKVSGIRRD